jgi:predicted ATPase
MSGLVAVLTSGPNGGKTTLVQHFHRLGYEVALGREQALRSSLGPNDVAFTDRSFVDNLGYFAQAGVRENPAIRQAAMEPGNRYSAVFVLAELPYDTDEQRIESPAKAAELHAAIPDAYRSVGYEPISVPVMRVEERADFVLAKMKQIQEAMVR